MAGHRRSKNGVSSFAYVPAIHVLLSDSKAWMPATSAGMTEAPYSGSMPASLMSDVHLTCSVLT
jgi:hypothetical protein